MDSAIPSAGVFLTASAGDHVHPQDTTRAPTASPSFTGTVNSAGKIAIADTTDGTSGAGSLTTQGGIFAKLRAYIGDGVSSVAGKLDLDGPAGTNNGPAVNFRYAGAAIFAFGRSAGILGGTLDDFVITADGRADGVASIDITKGTNAGTPAGGIVSFMNGLGIPAGGSASARILFGGGNLGLYWGSGAPTVSAAQGSLYIRTDGSTVASRFYINTNGSTTWTSVNTQA